MKGIGLAGVTGILSSIAGCSSDDGSSEERGEQVPTLEVIGYPESNRSSFDTLTEIVDEVENLGFDLEYNPVSRDRHLDLVFYEHDYEISSLGYTGRPERLDPNALPWGNYHSSEIEGGAYNWTGTDYPEIDEALEAQRELLDPDERQPLVHEMQEVIMSIPGGEMPIEHPDLVNVYNSEKFDGFVAVPGLGMNNYDTWLNVEALGDDREMTCGYPLDVPHITPLQANETNQIVNRICHDTLTVVGDDGLPTEWLATDWEISADNTRIDFTIREGHEFNDGEPCTAEDVVFTYEYIMEWEVPFLISSLGALDEVYADGNIVTFELSEPDAPIFNDAFSRIQILPEHIWSQIPDADDDIDAPFEWSPTESDLTDNGLIGSGPYEFDEWRRGSGVRLTVRDSHPVGTPDIDSIFIQTIESPSALTTALRNEEIDFVIDTDADSQVLDDLASEEDHLEFVATESVGYDEWAMNTRVEPLGRESVRQAMSAMIPKERIAQEVWRGYAQPAISPISPALEFWHNPDVEKWHEYSMEDAVEWLEEDGFVVEEDGIYYPVDGFED
ncbi:ABC transporter substrate-binding protein [Halalkalirubrum salinum]|uniref:ABC transporter substrate-binding protein n=1 Tax=Halalkalirubrum salinum TaxID=2563889 RepID=UPI0014856F6F|nr:ABC transporter substrate-binding protein [Halalkalirubrum salinum]